MPRYPHISDWIEARTDAGLFLVHRFNVALTPTVVYEAWECLDGHSTSSYSSPLGPIGKVSSRPLAEWMEALRPGTAERIDAARAWREDVQDVALEAIVAAYPDVMGRVGARIDGARIETCELAGMAVA